MSVLIYKKGGEQWSLMGEYPDKSAVDQFGSGDYKLYESNLTKDRDGMPTGFKNPTYLTARLSITTPKV